MLHWIDRPPWPISRKHNHPIRVFPYESFDFRTYRRKWRYALQSKSNLPSQVHVYKMPNRSFSKFLSSVRPSNMTSVFWFPADESGNFTRNCVEITTSNVNQARFGWKVERPTPRGHDIVRTKIVHRWRRFGPKTGEQHLSTGDCQKVRFKNGRSISLQNRRIWF